MALPSPLPVRDGVNATRLRLPATGPWETVQDYVLDRFGHVDPEGIRRRFTDGEVVDAAGTPLTAATRLGAVEDLWYYRSVPQEEPIPFEVTVLHRDEHLLAVDKPHFLPTTPGGRFVQESALVRLRRALDLDELVPLHRLDRATAGVLLFSTQPATRGAYQVLFERRQVHKTYEAVSALPARTTAADLTARLPLTVRSRIRKDKGILRSITEEIAPADSGRRAGTPSRGRAKTNRPHAGANAESRVELLGVGPSAGVLAGAPVVHTRLTPRTGRTHQLRIHLAALGLGILHDGFYPELLDPAPDDHARPLQLLARTIGFTDPLSGAERVFTSGLRLQEAPA